MINKNNMATPNPSPTILVKKHDGSFVRLTLAEVKKLQEVQAAEVQKQPEVQTLAENNSQQNKVVLASQPITTPRSTITPHPTIISHPTTTPESITTSQPIVSKPKTIANIGSNNVDDYQSLLNETLPLAGNPAAPLISVPRTNQVQMVIGQLPFTPHPAAINRLRTVVQLRLKDIRGVEATKEILRRSMDKGGVGLDESQASSVMAELAKAHQPDEKLLAAPDVPLLSNERHSPPTKSTISANSAIPTSPANHAPIFKLQSQPPNKVTMHDISPQSTTMGPVDEVAYFNLADFRGLAADPDEAARRFKQKLLNMQEESIVLYLEAVKAWRSSPLYQEYMNMVMSALGGHTPLDRTVVDKNKLQLKELKAIVNMNQSL